MGEAPKVCVMMCVLSCVFHGCMVSWMVWLMWLVSAVDNERKNPGPLLT